MDRGWAYFVTLCLAVGAFGGSGCALPFAIWPELPTGLGRTLPVRDPQGRPVSDGYVLLRVYEYNGAGVAEGDRNVRNQQVFDAAFAFRQPIRVNVPAKTVKRYRLVHMKALPIGDDGTVRVSPMLQAGTLWLVPKMEKAKEGVHRRFHFAEVQALARGRPPGERCELNWGRKELHLADRPAPLVWRRELESALMDMEQAAVEAFVAAEFVEEELGRLKADHPEAFVPDGVGTGPNGRMPAPPPPGEAGEFHEDTEIEMP